MPASRAWCRSAIAVFVAVGLGSGALLAQPAVHLGTVTITPVGDGDGLLEAGEVATIAVELFNDESAASGFSAVLSTATPGVTILNGSSGFPVIAPGGSATAAEAFSFVLTPSFVCETSIAFTLAVSNGGPPAALAFSATPGPGSPATFTYSGPPVGIPDGDGVNPPGPEINVPLSVSGVSRPIAKVTFRFNGSLCNTIDGSTTVGLDHTFVGDLVVRLRSPAGTEINLIRRLTNGVGGNGGNNFCNTVLDDAAADSIQTQVAAPFTGTFRPDQPLATFDGENANGSWVLKVADWLSTDTGSVRDFSLLISTCTGVCPAATDPTVAITASGPTTICTGGGVTLTAPVAASYLWSTGETTQSIVVNQGGTYNVAVTSAAGCSRVGSATVTVLAASPVTISPASLPGGTVGTSYNETVTAADGQAPYTFAVTAGGLPGGLSLSPTGGLSGTPVSAGSFPFTVAATDAAACVGQRSYTLTVLPEGPVITAIVPSTGSIAGGLNVTLQGLHLAGATSVTFGGTAATIVSNTGTSLVVVTPAHAAGSVAVAVTTAGGTATIADGFAFFDPAIPTLSGSLLLVLACALAAAALLKLRV